jgi:hypothetical protein
VRWRQVLWDALTVHVHVAEETAEVARKAERAAQLVGPAGTAAAMAAARAAATTPVLERLSGSVQLVLERAWGAMHRLAAEVEVELWDALCTPLSGDTFAAMVSLVASLQTCFITTPAEQAAMQAAAMQAGPRSPAHVGVIHSPSLAQPVTLCRIKLANMLLRIREADALQYELLLQGVTLWTVQVTKMLDLWLKSEGGRGSIRPCSAERTRMHLQWAAPLGGPSASPMLARVRWWDPWSGPATTRTCAGPSSHP